MSNHIPISTEPAVVVTMIVVGITFLSAILLAKKSFGGPAKALDATQYLPFPLIKKIEVSHDTKIFRLGLPTPQHVLGLPIGQHISLKATINGKDVMRSYTPISSDDDKGFVDVLVKVYYANVHPKFPEGGAMSQHLDQMKIGDTILVKGPSGRLEYTGGSVFKLKQGQSYVDKKVSKVAMISGGTGITPMMQVVRAVLKDPTDKTQMSLVFANQTEADILLRAELDEAAKDPRFKVWYTLDRPGEGWKYSSGFVDYDMLKANLPEPDANTMVLMCGPPPMINFACKPNLEKCGYKPEQMFTF